MALVTCKDCKREFSTDVKRCPNCGAKPPHKTVRWLKVVLCAVFGIPLIGAIVGGGESDHSSPRDYVLPYCMAFIKDSLHDPDSAEFDRNTQLPIAIGDDKYRMIVALRAKNGFGSLRHFAIDCTVRANGKSWSLVSLKELN